jgi:hypothetical protein
MEVSASMENLGTAALPNWETQRGEICCPMCEYNLRGLTEPRCPECGYRFEWKDLLDAKVRPHPYLFEHHPERNFKSFWQTAWGGLRPWKFWRELHAGQLSRPKRLFAYWLFASAFILTALLVLAVGAGITLAASASNERQTLIRSSGGAIAASGQAAYLDQRYPLPPDKLFFHWLWDTRADLQVTVALAGIILAWPWLTYLMLMIFRISMRRARIKSIHVRRSIIYCFDAAIWASLLALLIFPLREWLWSASLPYNSWSSFGGYVLSRPPLSSARFFSGAPSDFYMHCANSLAGVAVAVGAWRLTIAYRRYLRFDWPVATVLASQVILLLALVVIAFNWSSPLASYWRDLLGY